MIEIFRYFLEIKNLNELNYKNKPVDNCKVVLLNPSNYQINRLLYTQIGKKHRWTDRLTWNENKWIKYVDNSNVKTFILEIENELIGFYEQIYNFDNDDYEIAYFGILEKFRKKGYGSYLLSNALKKILNKKPKRVWVHTCSLDHKNAINNYLSRGMKIFKKEKVKIPA